LILPKKKKKQHSVLVFRFLLYNSLLFNRKLADNEKKDVFIMFTPEYWMRKAIEEGLKAFRDKEVPVGAVIVKGRSILGKAGNCVEKLKDPTAHAEILAITQACEQLGDWRLEGCTLYVTKEPCVMCAGAIRNARIKEIYFGLRDEAEGACGGRYEDLLRDEKSGYFASIHAGLMEEEVKQVFAEFFRQVRTKIRNKEQLT
jgi:tRNA(adenine34) deaminase